MGRAILMCGTDERLLELRARVLGLAAFQVDVAKRPAEAQLLLREQPERYGLLLVCYTMPAEARAILQHMAMQSGLSSFQMEWLLHPDELIAEVSRRLPPVQVRCLWNEKVMGNRFAEQSNSQT